MEKIELRVTNNGNSILNTTDFEAVFVEKAAKTKLKVIQITPTDNYIGRNKRQEARSILPMIGLVLQIKGELYRLIKKDRIDDKNGNPCYEGTIVPSHRYLKYLWLVGMRQDVSLCNYKKRDKEMK